MIVPLALGVLILGALAASARASAAVPVYSVDLPYLLTANDFKRGEEYPKTARSLAEKWGPIFGVSPSWVISHCFVESTNRPLEHNKKGNVYGFMQIKPGTAGDIARWMKESGLSLDRRVSWTLSLWKGQGKDLFNPDLNVMMGTFYLRYLKNKFKTSNHKIVASAYNQGPLAMTKALKKGRLTDKMKEYVAMIEKAKKMGYA